MPTGSWNPAELLKLSGSYWNTCTLHAGVKLDVFSPLATEQLSAAELAARRGFSARGLAMLLDALTALELLTKEGERYTATDFAREFLDRAAPSYLGHMIMHHHHLVASWARLDEAVRSGAPVRRSVSHEAEEQERESFLLGMFNLAMFVAPRVAEQVDLSGRKRLLDLGGGPGTYAIHFCQKNPELQGVIFDLATTRPFAEKTLARFGMSERIHFAAGDFEHDAIPGTFDVAWLSHVLHGEGPDDCAHLLAKATAALEPGGMLLVQEFVLDGNRAAPLFPALFSLNMLLVTRDGQAYSEPEIRQLMEEAGLARIERLLVDLPNGAGILAGYKD
ncbi:methyltransferase [Desulfuromonas acetexigens]|jgi:ubiquinone/menaquinone biosynthesis C-methylase UbiE|uniref:Methyltransferase domain-containing protein n=1 Tax=Trichloromonas acetexigens TaxID=38815 RepID=A0A550J7X2_9BACT|nr:methyltransferase [Desulfuromonas acetexigens]TRO79326.1 methyltransferase domain-containing protein [Desulfuromonas acetexigens]